MQILKLGLETLYKEWKDGGKLFLSFGDNSWEIDVQWKDGTCILGKGWYEITTKLEMKDGDTLVLFRLRNSETKTVNASLFQGKNIFLMKIEVLCNILF